MVAQQCLASITAVFQWYSIYKYLKMQS